MNFNRIYAIILRYLYAEPILNRIYKISYWNILNIVIWGTTSKWIQTQTNNPELGLIILTGLAFWQIVFRVNIETAKNLSQELNDKNLVNLFSSPLNLSEWICAISILNLIETILVILIGSLLIKITYSINIMKLGWIVIPSTILLWISGLFIGFLICSILIRAGKRVQDLIYSLGYIFAPFSAIYYPAYMMPGWVKYISIFLPTTYVFENIRYIISNGQSNFNLIIKSLMLNIIYLTLSIIIFNFMFKSSKARGLLSLE